MRIKSATSSVRSGANLEPRHYLMKDSSERSPPSPPPPSKKRLPGSSGFSAARTELLDLLDHASDLILSFDPAGRFHFVNQTWRTTLGYAPAEIARLRFEDTVDSADRAALQAILETLSIPGKSLPFEARFRANGGPKILVAGTLTRRRVPKNPTGTIICVCHLVTAERAAERKASEILAREKQLNELRADFVSTASHEMRTPLATLSLGVDFLVKYWSKLDEKQIAHSLGSVHAGVQQLRSVLDDVLIVGRSREGRLSCKPEPVELITFCRKLTEEVMAGDLSRHPIEWHCNRAVWDAKIDPKLLRQILVNLLTNACKFSPQSTVVELSLESRDESLVFTVADRGIGIPAEDQGRLFDLFFRGANSTQVAGSGLGLTVVRHCIEAHSGSVAFESAPGRGTRFLVTVPA
jgi:PAS domain S-box-containing protein